MHEICDLLHIYLILILGFTLLSFTYKNDLTKYIKILPNRCYLFTSENNLHLFPDIYLSLLHSIIFTFIVQHFVWYLHRKTTEAFYTASE